MTTEEIFGKLKRIISFVLDIDDRYITNDTNIVCGLGADSIDIVDIFHECEKEFDIIIPFEELDENPSTVEDIVEIVKKYQN